MLLVLHGCPIPPEGERLYSSTFHITLHGLIQLMSCSPGEDGSIFTLHCLFTIANVSISCFHWTFAVIVRCSLPLRTLELVMFFVTFCNHKFLARFTISPQGAETNRLFVFSVGQQHNTECKPSSSISS